MTKDPYQPIDRRDGSTKGEIGITTVNNLYCRDQISNSTRFVENFDKMAWAGKNGCQMATCPLWGKHSCQMNWGLKDPKSCPIFESWKVGGYWSADN